MSRVQLLSFLVLAWVHQAQAAPSCQSLFSNKEAVIFNSPPFAKLQWLVSEGLISLRKIMANISPADAKPGAIIAGQTRSSPNYYFHWVRDAGLVADAILQSYRTSKSISEKAAIKAKLLQYLDFSEHIQNTSSIAGLGEAKYNVDGSPFMEPWGRPQTDSPALRSLSLIHLAKQLKSEGLLADLQNRLYDGKFPSDSVIKKDLEYIAHNWKLPSTDIWEEVKGDHFYTRMVQRRALLEGADLAQTLGDPGAASFYKQQAAAIEKTILEFWDAKKGHFVATLNQIDGLVTNKNSGLDVSVLLGLLHGGTNDGFLKFSDPKVQKTLTMIIKTFHDKFGINQDPTIPGTAIGRYPEDQFDGAGRNGGNPWVLCTLAVAEVYYKMASEARTKNQTQQALAYIRLGDQFVQRVQYHAHKDGSLNEQMNRDTGYMTSVADLTWSYASLLTALAARNHSVRP